MPIHSNLAVLIAQANVVRAKRHQPRLSLRLLAEESGVSLSVLVALNTGKSTRIGYETIDKLLSYFSEYIEVDTADLLIWERNGSSMAKQMITQQTSD